MKLLVKKTVNIKKFCCMKKICASVLEFVFVFYFFFYCGCYSNLASFYFNFIYVFFNAVATVFIAVAQCYDTVDTFVKLFAI